jgi:hypothetical protein
VFFYFVNFLAFTDVKDANDMHIVSNHVEIQIVEWGCGSDLALAVANMN